MVVKKLRDALQGRRVFTSFYILLPLAIILIPLAISVAISILSLTLSISHDLSPSLPMSPYLSLYLTNVATFKVFAC